EEEVVGVVMHHEEGSHAYALMGRDATVEDALSAFDEYLHQGKSLHAIILTHSGKESERPLGIVTVSDMPKLLGALRA
ncbi:MAG TPA: hypothetical protein VFT74_00470, partial [Isosphaeraceae bacterium]|nr:hypothetical protein [Isosphaeraceae bacterium]